MSAHRAWVHWRHRTLRANRWQPGWRSRRTCSRKQKSTRSSNVRHVPWKHTFPHLDSVLACCRRTVEVHWASCRAWTVRTVAVLSPLQLSIDSGCTRERRNGNRTSTSPKSSTVRAYVRLPRGHGGRQGWCVRWRTILHGGHRTPREPKRRQVHSPKVHFVPIIRGVGRQCAVAVRLQYCLLTATQSPRSKRTAALECGAGGARSAAPTSVPEGRPIRYQHLWCGCRCNRRTTNLQPSEAPSGDWSVPDREGSRANQKGRPVCYGRCRDLIRPRSQRSNENDRL